MSDRVPDKRAVACVLLRLCLAAFLLSGLGRVSIAEPFVYFANLTAKRAVSVIDAASGVLVKTIDLDIGTNLMGALSISATSDGRLAYVLLESLNTFPFEVSLQAIDTDPLSATFNQPVGSPIPLGPLFPFRGITFNYITVSPDGRLIYVPNISGSVLSVNTATHTISSLPVAHAVKAVFSPDSSRAYLSLGLGAVGVVDTTSGLQTDQIPVGNAPDGIAITPDGKTLVVANSGSDSVSIICTATNAVIASVPVAAGPEATTTTFDGKFAYVTSIIPHASTGVVSKIDIDPTSSSFSKVIGAPISVGFQPESIAITPDGRTAYVGNFGDTTVSVVDTLSGNVRTMLLGANPRDVTIAGRRTCRVKTVTPFYQAVDPHGNVVPWACDIYNHPYSWDTPSRYCSPPPTFTRIAQKGCSLTTLTMALTSAGIDFTDPSFLNNYMVNHLGDFDPGSHDVNWSATVDDLAITSGKSVLFNDFTSTSVQDLENKVCGSGLPVIVGVDLSPSTTSPGLIPGHFVLVTGKQGNQFQIVDPGHPNRTTLDAYQNIFEARGYISDPSGDRSALHVSANDTELLLTDPVGNRTGFDPSTNRDVHEIGQSVYARDALENDETGAPATQVGHFINVRTPMEGSYKVVVNGSHLVAYTLAIKDFSVDGNAQAPIVFAGLADSGTTSVYQLQFVSAPGTTSQITLLATFQSTLDDINSSLKLGLIDNGGIANALSAKINVASDAAAGGDSTTAFNVLNAFKKQVGAQTGKHINGIAPQVLQQDADSLLGRSSPQQ